MIQKFYDNSAVRRQDRLLDAERAEELLREAEFGVLSTTDDNGEAYGVPLNFAWDEACPNEGAAGAIYIHCATEGKKLRAISGNAGVSFCIVGDVKPQPENLTTLYESIIIKGKARIGIPDDERRHALRLLVRKFAPDQIEHGERSIEKSFHRTEIIRIDIEQISGKAKRPKAQAKKYTDVFLDFDDTLYDTHGNACKVLEVVFEHFGLGRWFARPEDFTVPYWEVNEQLWAQYAAGEIERPYLIVERFRRPLSLGRWIGGESDSEIQPGTSFEPTEAFCLEVSDFFLDRCCEQIGVVPGAIELLKYLKTKGYRLHMTSNGFHEVQFKKLAAVGMTDYFDTVILSEDAGINKPAPKFFDYAFRASGADPKSTILIGDNLVTDIDGARRAGLPQIWFNPRGNPRPDSPITHIVNKLSDIETIL